MGRAPREIASKQIPRCSLQSNDVFIPGSAATMFTATSIRNMVARTMGGLLFVFTTSGMAMPGGPLVLEREGRTISLEPYAPNILRITMRINRAAAAGPPGYGFAAKPTADGWTHERDAKGYEVFRSGRMVVRVAPGNLPEDQQPKPMPLDKLNLDLRDIYFGGGPGGNGPNDGGIGPHNDSLEVTTPEGKTLLHMRSWAMDPESEEVAVRDAGAKGYRVVSTFDSPSDEHYYGLGQQQKGWMDLRDHEIRCWHDYSATGGENVCVPFMVSSRGYGLVWDNPSKTTVDLGFNGRNVWSSEVGDRVSYFVIVGADQRRDLRRLPFADRHNAHAAEGHLWIYPEQGDLSNTGTGSRRGEGVSPEESAARRDGRGLPEHDEAR